MNACFFKVETGTDKRGNCGVEHISVCVCTFKRPSLLKQSLERLQRQTTNGQFTYSILVVDNDCALSGLPAVREVSKTSPVTVEYVSEPEQNISLARNKAIEHAWGTYLAFLDDDEFPSETWLLNLYTVFKTHKPSGGVLGPVYPHYPEGTPRWLVNSKMCERPDHRTGTVLDWGMTRGGNVLLSRAVFADTGLMFDAKYGRTGGEDKELFKTLMQHGYSFIWCHEAAMYEVIYPDRWKLSHYLYRNLMNGGVTGDSIGKYSLSYLMRSLTSLSCYSGLLLASIFTGRAYMFKQLNRVVYDFGRVMGCLGCVFVKQRRD